MGQASPDIRTAIIKGAIVEAIVIGAGVTAFFFTNNLAWLVVAAVMGAATMMFFLVQAGMFDTRRE